MNPERRHSVSLPSYQWHVTNCGGMQHPPTQTTKQTANVTHMPLTTINQLMKQIILKQKISDAKALYNELIKIIDTKVTITHIHSKHQTQ